jgi:hypothetical protein
VLDSWERHHAVRWRTLKMRHDAEVQIREIESHRCRLSRERGTDIDFCAAARDWVANCEAQWRDRWEQQPEAGA